MKETPSSCGNPTKCEFVCTFLALTLLVLQFFGCATIFSGRAEEIKFTSVQTDVRVFVGGRLAGTTPITIRIHKESGKGKLVKFEKEGFRSQEFALQNRLDNLFFLNISSLSSSWIGGGIDALTGAIKEYDPKSYHVDLIPINKTSANLRGFRIRQFVFDNYENISADLSKGSGQYIESLSAIISENASERTRIGKLLTNRKESLVHADNPLEFLRELDGIIANQKGLEELRFLSS